VKKRLKEITGAAFTYDDHAIGVHWLHRYPGDYWHLTYILDAADSNFYDVIQLLTSAHLAQIDGLTAQSRSMFECRSHLLE